MLHGQWGWEDFCTSIVDKFNCLESGRQVKFFTHLVHDIAEGGSLQVELHFQWG